MNRTFAAGLLALAAAAPMPAQVLAKRLDQRLDAPGLDRLLWGVAVTDLDGHLLYGRNAERVFIPASNTKLVVSAVATALLGTSFTVATSAYGTGPVVDGVLQGDLVLYGRGDPTFSHRCYDLDTLREGACDRDPAARLTDLASQLRARGIRVVAGDLVGDGSYFTPELIHPSWQNYDLGWWYAAPVSGLGFNDNSIDVREVAGDTAGVRPQVTFSPDIGAVSLDNRAEVVPRGGRRSFDLFRSSDGLSYLATGVLVAGAQARTEYAAVLDPNRFTALAFRSELQKVGILVRGTTRSTTDSLQFRDARAREVLAEVRSRPFGDWLFPILNNSQNWFAEMTLKQLGRQRGAAGSWSEGIRVERRFLIDSMGIDSTQFSLEDGSGLTASNFVSPLAFTKLLAFMHRQPAFATFEAALPQGGKRGTLSQRFTGTPVEGRVHAKTGTIRGVSTLSGYLDHPDGRTLIFSVMANHHTLAGSAMTAAIDSVIVELGRTAKKR